MPRYHFHTEDGRCFPDDEGTELPNLSAARTTAVKLLGELLKDQPKRLLETATFTVTVTDDDRLTLFTVNVGMNDAAAVAGNARSGAR